MTEFYPKFMKANNIEPIDYVSFLTNESFSLFPITKNLSELKKIEPENIIKNYTAKKGNYVYLLCKKNH